MRILFLLSGLLLLSTLVAVPSAWSASDALYFPNLGANATGTNTAGKIGADVFVSGGTVTTVDPLLNAVGKVRNDYTGTPVTTAAYVQLIASTASVAKILEIFDSSGQTLVLAFGAAAAEVDQIYITPGGNGFVKILVPLATRVSVKAVSANATAGEIDLNLYN